MPIKRGEIYWVDFNPSRGSEQAGRRPALVVQNDRGNRASPCTVIVAVTSAELRKPYPFTVPLATGEAGLSKASYVNCSQMHTIVQSRLERRIGALDDSRVQEVDVALRFQLSL